MSHVVDWQTITELKLELSAVQHATDQAVQAKLPVDRSRSERQTEYGPPSRQVDTSVVAKDGALEPDQPLSDRRTSDGALHKTVAERDELAQKLDEKTREHVDATSELMRVQRDHDKIESELDAVRAEIDQLKRAGEDASIKIVGLEQDLADAKDATASISRERDEVTGRLERVQKERDQWRSMAEKVNRQ